MINVILVEQRLGLISGYLTNLIAAAESFLRRTLEAIFDVGRHVLAKSGFLELAGEYKSIARGLSERGFIDKQLGEVLVEMAGYRNRMVHLYNEVTADELHSIIANHLADIREFARQMRASLQGR